MADPLDLDGLPPALAAVMRPWLGVVRDATLGMGDEVKAGASVAGTGLQRRIVMTPALEEAIEAAQSASQALAVELDRRTGALPAARVATQAALAALVKQLLGATPNARARGLGLSW